MPTTTSKYKILKPTGSEPFEINTINKSFEIIDSLPMIIVDHGTVLSDGLEWRYKKYMDKSIELNVIVPLSSIRVNKNDMATGFPYYSEIQTVNIPFNLSEVSNVNINSYKNSSTTFSWCELVGDNLYDFKDVIKFRVLNTASLSYTSSYNLGTAFIEVKGVEI